MDREESLTPIRSFITQVIEGQSKRVRKKETAQQPLMARKNNYVAGHGIVWGRLPDPEEESALTSNPLTEMVEAVRTAVREERAEKENGEVPGS